MKEYKGDMIKGGEPLHEFWTKGGFVLCTAGYADIRINDQMYRLTRGSVFIVTPLVQIYDFTPSSDYTQISFVNDLKVFFPIFKSISVQPPFHRRAPRAVNSPYFFWIYL